MIFNLAWLSLFFKNIFTLTFCIAYDTTYVALKCQGFQPVCIYPASWVLSTYIYVCVLPFLFCHFLDTSPTVWRHVLDWFYLNVFPLNGNCVFHKRSWQRDTIKKCFMSTVTHGCSSSWHLTISSFFVSGFG